MREPRRAETVQAIRNLQDYLVQLYACEQILHHMRSAGVVEPHAYPKQVEWLEREEKQVQTMISQRKATLT